MENLSYITSAFPLAIPTSIAFESYFEHQKAMYDPNRVIAKPHSPIETFTDFHINIDTLIRNLFGSLPMSPEQARLSDLTIDINAELDYILDFLDHTNRDINVSFYSSRLKYIIGDKKLMRRLRIPKSPKVVAIRTMMAKLSSMVIKRPDVTVYDNYLIPETNSKCLVLTHLAYDLIEYMNTSKFILVESHTGKSKDPTDFYSKLAPTAKLDMSVIPLTRSTLRVFGDSLILKSAPYASKISVYHLAMEKRWGLRTSDTIIKTDIRKNSPDVYGELF